MESRKPAVRTTQQLSITLCNELAEAVKAKVASGEYATESEVIRDGLRALIARDRAMEASRVGTAMNKDQMKKNLHAHAQLRPPACRLDQNGAELAPGVYVGENDTWFIQDVSDAGVQISHASGHVRLLGYDHIYKFTSDEPRQGTKRGFLTLHVQLFIQGNNIRLEPNARPGEPVAPLRPASKLVESSYPVDSGIQQKNEAQGFRISWSRPESVSGLIDMQGFEVVVEPDGRGGLSTFRTRDGAVLVRQRIRAT